jgi:hypothetical protein
MGVPYTFGTATTSIPLSQLDANFNTPVTLGNTTVGLGNTVTTVGNLTLTNVTITSGTINAAVVDSGYVANSVVYADSSGVLTAGSANLVFTGTNLGIGTSSPATLLSLAANNTGAENNTLRFWDTATNTTANQQIGKIEFYSSDTSTPGAGVKSYIGAFATDGTPDAYLAFATADGAAQATERMRIDSSGQIGIGGTPTASVTLDVSKVVGIGQNTAYGIWSRGSAAPTSNNNVSNYVSTISTSANGGTPYTITTLAGFRALEGTINADSTATNQYGFFADASLTGATNNYGFYGNIASGTNRWNFYANGTAANYFAGQVQLAAGSAGTPALSAFGDTNTGIFFPAADTIAFTEGGVESMRIDSSGNVGIGTSSPTAKLYVNANNATATQILQDETNGAKLRCITNSINVDFGNSGGGGYLAVSGAYPLTFSTNSSERMRIDSSGNVGIGTSSPNADSTVFAPVLSVKGGSFDGVVELVGSRADGSATGVGQLRFVQNANTTGKTISYIIGETEGATANNRGGTLQFWTKANAGSLAERMRITSGGNVGIGTTSPNAKLNVVVPNLSTVGLLANSGLNINTDGGAVGNLYQIGFGYGVASTYASSAVYGLTTDSAGYNNTALCFATRSATTDTAPTERMRITSAGDVFIGRTSDTDVAGISLVKDGFIRVNRDSAACMIINRNVDDGDLVVFRQASATEGSISVSGSTVSYNGGHLSRWSQWQNQTGKPEVYRGSVLESTNDMCEWNQDNEQATKTIISSTVKSKAVAGVFDMYDTDDKDNPYDFYVAQSGDFVIRIAQGVVVENGDLLESAGDGTAKPQTDDICRSSTVAKVTSNYVSTTYADGSYCVPCILMIG